MDKIKIGKFISKCRKEKQLTQEQLAEKLNVTSKSVSKWENGLCLPDASLYEPLCDALDISINELFSGKNKEIEVNANEDLLKMLKYQLYSLSDKSIDFDQFDNALTRISETSAFLKQFPSKEEAVTFLIKETNCSYEECSKAYDFYIQLFDINKFK